MKKILAILLALVFALSAMVLTACDTGTTETTEAETTAPETTDTEAPTNGGNSNTAGTLTENTLTGGTEVQNLGGKTAYQLYTEAGTKLSSATEFRMEGYEQEGTQKSTITVQLSDKTVYQKLASESSTIEGWFVDGYMYQNSNGTKTKYEGAFDSLKNSALRFTTGYYVPDVAESKFEGVKLMKTGDGIYYFTVAFTEADAVAMAEGKAFNYTMAFDKDGVICQINIEMISETTQKIVLVYDLGDIADVTAPADAASYTEGGSSSGSSGGSSGGSSSGKEPIKFGNIYVGDMDGDGDIDDFDVYIQERGNYKEMNNDGVLTIDDVLYDGEMSASMWKTIVNQYAKEYAKN